MEEVEDGQVVKINKKSDLLVTTVIRTVGRKSSSLATNANYSKSPATNATFYSCQKKTAQVTRQTLKNP